MAQSKKACSGGSVQHAAGSQGGPAPRVLGQWVWAISNQSPAGPGDHTEIHKAEAGQKGPQAAPPRRLCPHSGQNKSALQPETISVLRGNAQASAGRTGLDKSWLLRQLAGAPGQPPTALLCTVRRGQGCVQMRERLCGECGAHRGRWS